MTLDSYDTLRSTQRLILLNAILRIHDVQQLFLTPYKPRERSQRTSRKYVMDAPKQTYTIKVKDFSTLAKFVVGFTKPVVKIPDILHKLLTRAISLRKKHNSAPRGQQGPNEQETHKNQKSLMRISKRSCGRKLISSNCIFPSTSYLTDLQNLIRARPAVMSKPSQTCNFIIYVAILSLRALGGLSGRTRYRSEDQGRIQENHAIPGVAVKTKGRRALGHFLHFHRLRLYTISCAAPVADLFERDGFFYGGYSRQYRHQHRARSGAGV